MDDIVELILGTEGRPFLFRFFRFWKTKNTEDPDDTEEVETAEQEMQPYPESFMKRT